MNTRRAFVTGGTGFLGFNIVLELVERGWHVTALHRPGSNTADLAARGVDLVEGALDDSSSLVQAIPEGVDAVFHVAASTSFWRRNNRRQHRDNVIGTRNVVEAALERNVRRFMHTSSSAVYGFGPSVITEDSPHLGAESWIGYFRTKAQAEDEVRDGIENGLDAVFLNPANVIGPWDRHNWSRMIRMVADEKLPGVPPGRGSFCHPRAVAEAHVEAVDRGVTGRNYLLACSDASFLEVVQEMARQLGKPIPEKSTPAWLLRIVGRASHLWSFLSNREPDLTPEGAAMVCGTLVCSAERAAAELGYRPRSLESMIADCIAWMGEEGMLPANRGR